MRFTEEEKEKVLENIRLIKQWIDDNCNVLRETIKIPIPHQTYNLKFYVSDVVTFLVIGSRTVYLKEVNNNFVERDVLISEYNIEHAFTIIKHWPIIKQKLLDIINKQEEDLNTLMNFSI